MSIFKRRAKDRTNIIDFEKVMGEIECDIKKLERRYKELKKKMERFTKEENNLMDLERDVIQLKIDNIKFELNTIFKSLEDLFKRMKLAMLLNLLNEEKEFLREFEYVKGRMDLDRVEREIENKVVLSKIEEEKVDDILNILTVYLGGEKDVFEEEKGRDEKTRNEIENITAEETPERGDEQIREVEE